METKVVPIHYAYLDSHGLYHGKHLHKRFLRKPKQDMAFELLMLDEKLGYVEKKINVLDNYVFRIEQSPPKYYIEKIPMRHYFRGERDKLYNWVKMIRIEIGRIADNSVRRLYNEKCTVYIRQIDVMDVIIEDALDLSLKNYVLRFLGLGVA
jgi:hypothetical protein